MSGKEGKGLLSARTADLCAAFFARGFAQSEFLTQEEQVLVRRLIERSARTGGFSYAFCGGVEGSERRTLVLYEDEADVARRSGIRLLLIVPRGEESLSHRDVLGALMALGLAREAIGDIFPYKEGAAVALKGSLAPFVTENLRRVGRQSVEVFPLCLPEGYAIEKKTEETVVNVASLRLDGVAAELCRCSRASAAELIKEGLVQVDHEVCLQPDRKICAGQTLSLRGHGRFLLTDEQRRTKSGRIAVKVLKYV